MPPILFDTSIYISALRQKAVNALARLSATAPVWLSAVVLEELYAGARDRDLGMVEQLERDFSQANRIVVPNVKDWAKTGRLLGQFAARYGYEQIARGRLTNDALIATSAGRCGVRVITANERDFRRLSALYDFQWEPVTLSS